MAAMKAPLAFVGAPHPIRQWTALTRAACRLRLPCDCSATKCPGLASRLPGMNRCTLRWPCMGGDV